MQPTLNVLQRSCEWAMRNNILPNANKKIAIDKNDVDIILKQRQLAPLANKLLGAEYVL